MHQEFGLKLLAWYKNNHRDLPWNHTKDPYKIWISEIMLQQTRVNQGLPYYEKFIKRFPNIKSLALTKETEVLNYWEGLGYYSRARNLHHSAKFIYHDLNGVFPNTYDDILALKGVGKYTAAAVGSFAFDLPYAVVDGNVQRVLSRYFTIDDTVSYAGYLNDINSKITDVFVPNKAADFNRAIMNLGALICAPKIANCDKCPLSAECISFKLGTSLKFPPKKPKVNVENRFFHYLDFETSFGKRVVHQRLEKDIWSKLFQFTLIETDSPKQLLADQIKSKIEYVFGQSIDYTIVDQSKLTQRLTHRKIYAHFYKINLESKTKFRPKDGYTLISSQSLEKYAFPKIVKNYLNSLGIIGK